jgi:hypothetical protein
MVRTQEPEAREYVDLYWIPLGAGGWFVRRNGRLYERLIALRDRRKPLDLYHSAFEVQVPEGRFVIEVTPVPRRVGAERGVVAGGSVGMRSAGRLRVFRYEVRRWPGGRIPDVAQAVDSPRRLTVDSAVAHRLLQLVPHVPTPVWGRDELETGDMWNSNSVISWLIARSGLDVDAVAPPPGGRAPGWDAGITIARRAPGTPSDLPGRGARSAATPMARSSLRSEPTPTPSDTGVTPQVLSPRSVPGWSLPDAY